MKAKPTIKAALKEERYNLQHLADQMGCSYSHLTMAINGKRPASKAFIFLLVATLNEMTQNNHKFTTNDFKDLYTKDT